MEVRIKKDELVVKHKLKKNETYRISKGSKVESVSVFKKPEWVSGFSNITEDNKAILVIDYDGVNEGVVLEDYGHLQEEYNLPQAYLFKTKEDGYHVVCLKKFLNVGIAEILKHTRCDEAYKTLPLRTPYRSWVLRISGKGNRKRPKFIKMIGEEKNLYCEISSAHFKLLKKLFPKIKHPDYGNEDEFGKIKLQMYET